MSGNQTEEVTKLTKSELRPKFARDANIGLTHLWNLSHQALSIHPGLSGYYMSQFQKCSIFSEVAIHEKLKTNYCQSCGTVFVPGATCSVKLKKKDISAQRLGNSALKASSFKARTYNFKNSIKFEKSNPGSEGCKQNKGRKGSKSLRFSCSLCHANTFVPVLKKPKSAVSSILPPKIPIPRPNTQEAKTSDSKEPLIHEKSSKDSFKKNNKVPVAQVSKNMKQPFQPKPSAKKKGAKLNLSKILENDKKSKEEAKTKSQGFSLDDFLKGFN
ncbi:hypothetical protein DSO57_1027585 [Entomophthora muscae]|uniref:Uncharacterized protein n=1 Tax=Entomophthora muscae TaxID=34485 RepID=A0ACC2TD84_9FUNG|nr:hypothetical protein DSO57_1027585 [Entomophthora muscae]